MLDGDDGPTETDVDAVIHEFKGDHRGAIHALLHDLWVLAADFAEAVSLGYVVMGACACVMEHGGWQSGVRMHDGRRPTRWC